ncbi:ATP-binding protein [Alteromonas sp. W364]|uniref:ATP-binding protein n=1 Tax=Alteromonas sp. W364 TaxID=3075610 RepID=UPI002883CAE1|nr:ATP-binding protein [Alteromonas sp. W364]MDT0629973.1 ATP-binding protein [Alteromonas sp. W364]
MKQIVVLFIACLSMFTAHVCAGDDKLGKHTIPNELNILFLNGHDPVLPWTQDIIKGMSRSIARSPVKVNLFVENVYTDLIKDESNYSALLANIERVFANRNIDVIVTDDFLGKTLLSQIQQKLRLYDAEIIVLNVVESSHLSLSNNDSDKDKSTFITQVNAIFDFVPKPGRIIINTNFENEYIAHYKKLIRHISDAYPNYQLEQLASTDENFEQELRSLTSNDLFIYFPVFQMRSVQSTSPKSALEYYAQLSDAPIFSFWSTLAGSGIVGGYLYDAELQGNAMINMALAKKGIIAPRKFYPVAKWVFDETRLAQFNFTLSDQYHEREVSILNPDSSLVERYALQIVFIFASISLTLLILFYLKHTKLKAAHQHLHEANLKAGQETKLAIESSESKSKFLAIISHEIRTPINGMMGVFDLLNTTKMSQRQRKLVDMGRFSTESLLRTVNDILDFSKLETNNFTLDVAGFSPKSLITELVDYAQILCEDKSVAIEQETEFLVDVPLLGDRSRIRQIIDNLVNNAVKFTPEGKISIGAKIHKSGTHYELECWVADTGIGISERAQEQLFSPFNQIHNYLQQSNQGTGLGLSICKELVGLMNGQIKLNSEVSKGTKVVVKIPFQRAQAIAAIEHETLPFDTSSLKSINILLVEDNPINQEIVRSQLQTFGLDCDIASDGLEAIELLRSLDKVYDLILMDIQMPVMDGYTAAKNIRAGDAGEKYNDIIIISLTAHASSDEKARAMQAGMNRHLNKPIVAKKLISEIYDVVAKPKGDQASQ